MRSFKRILVATAVIVIVCAFFFGLWRAVVKRPVVERMMDYGVFLGIGGEETEKLANYRIVVVEPSKFTAAQIKSLHDTEKTVYGYINIGALEEYRPFSDRFSEITLEALEDRKGENWVDVSSPDWQSFVVDELGRECADMGFDGFFLDNADVYRAYPEDHIFRGLRFIISGLRRYGLPIVINGGDTFVVRCIDEHIAGSLFSGVSQEEVFTSVDFKTGAPGRQGDDESAYLKRYLDKVKEYGLSVWLVEYGADEQLSADIDSYCREKGFLWYNAENIGSKQD